MKIILPKSSKRIASLSVKIKEKGASELSKQNTKIVLNCPLNIRMEIIA